MANIFSKNQIHVKNLYYTLLDDKIVVKDITTKKMQTLVSKLDFIGININYKTKPVEKSIDRLRIATLFIRRY